MAILRKMSTGKICSFEIFAYALYAAQCKSCSFQGSLKFEERCDNLEHYILGVIKITEPAN